MKFTAKDDLNAPRDAVFAALTDARWVESLALNRGVELRRVAGQGAATAGTRWHADVQLRGKARQVQVDVSDTQAPNRIIFVVTLDGLTADVMVELAPLAEVRTRMATEVRLGARSLAARLLVQSMKFTRGATEKRMRVRTAQFAQILAARADQRSDL